MKKYAKHHQVQWKWASGKPRGVVQAHYDSKVTKKYQGKNITRNGTPSNPAYIIKQSNGHLVVKLHSELLGEV